MLWKRFPKKKCVQVGTSLHVVHLRCSQILEAVCSFTKLFDVSQSCYQLSRLDHLSVDISRFYCWNDTGMLQHETLGFLTLVVLLVPHVSLISFSDWHLGNSLPEVPFCSACYAVETCCQPHVSRGACAIPLRLRWSSWLSKRVGVRGKSVQKLSWRHRELYQR